ncbi:MAG: hypothetical protein D3924_12625 [Candidatus Electrothrix sp. AR4]|nr:hypothetical protein [Candidatus Electrothrix sp. AR4]
MEIDKHRAASYCGFKRCRDAIPELREHTDYDKVFYPLWMGNWLTDMSQATAFFSVIPKLDFEKWRVSKYWLLFLKKIHEIFKDEWLKRYLDRKEAEFKLPYPDKKNEKTDHYQSRVNGGYVIPEFIMQDVKFKKIWENLFATLWLEEWQSAEAALENSQQMGDVQASSSITVPVDCDCIIAVTPGEAEEIGAYYPFDHFDVTDHYIVKDNQRVLNNREELELKDHEQRGFMTTTAEKAFAYALHDWLQKAFDATQDEDIEKTKQNRLDDYQALKTLGHGIHTLQDFYSHSNYTDLLLICMAQKNLLDEYWNKRIQYLVEETQPGTFNAFVLCKDHSDEKGKGEKTPLVTGRFDTIDTIHTLLHLSEKNLVSHDDMSAHSHEVDKENDRDTDKDALYRILFGTFSEIDVVQKFKGTVDAYRDFADYIDSVQEKMKDFFMENLVDPIVKDILKEKKQLLDTYLLLKDAVSNNKRSIKNYRKAGELMFHQHSIEDHLRKDISDAEKEGKIILPHHALLAKDHDKNNDAVKLSYKLSCALAAEVTTEVLVKYFQGASFIELEPLLRRRYVHPKFHVEKCEQTESLNTAIDALDKKWFWYASENPNDKRSILGFELEYL